jgi:hypothetical protein
MAARRMRHHDAANRPERRPLAAVRSSLGGGARRDGDRGSPGYRTGLPLPRRIDVVGRVTLRDAGAETKIAAVPAPSSNQLSRRLPHRY